jgi:hypothetical protein
VTVEFWILSQSFGSISAISCLVAPFHNASLTLAMSSTSPHSVLDSTVPPIRIFLQSAMYNFHAISHAIFISTHHPSPHNSSDHHSPTLHDSLPPLPLCCPCCACCCCRSLAAVEAIVSSPRTFDAAMNLFLLASLHLK